MDNIYYVLANAKGQLLVSIAEGGRFATPCEGKVVQPMVVASGDCEAIVDRIARTGVMLRRYPVTVPSF